MKHEPVISFAALARIVITGLIVFCAWKGMTILITLLIAILFAITLYPIAKKIHHKVPWVISVLGVVSLLLIPVLVIVIMLATSVSGQAPEVIENIRKLVEGFIVIPDAVKNLDIVSLFQGNVDYVFNSTKTIITIAGAIITVIVSVFYLMFDADRLLTIGLDLFPHEDKEIIREMFQEIFHVIGNYLRGNFVVSLVCATIIFIGLTLIGVPFALPLAIFTGILDLLPVIGPLLALVPAAILGLSHSPLAGLLVVILFIVYQQVENTFIAPYLYNKALNLSPALIFLSVVIGGGLFGVLGAFLALPVAASIPVVMKYRKKLQKITI
jgi:predicted PurR-regulated permease PerM